MNGLLWFISLGLFAGLTLFSVVFRRVRTELLVARNHGVPRAVISGGGARWAKSDPTLSFASSIGRGGGGLRARFAGGMPTLQAGIVATAAMSIFVMALCLVACVVLAVLGR